MSGKSNENNLLERIRWLENNIPYIHPAWSETSSWLDVIGDSDCLYWVWKTELVNPKYLPGLVTVRSEGTVISGQQYRFIWERYRYEGWSKKFWSDVPGAKPINGWYPKYQAHDDPDVPSASDALELFRKLLCTIPLATFEWAKDSWDRRPPHIDKAFVEFHGHSYYGFSHPAIEFLIAQRKARHWRNKLGDFSLEDIKLPNWAIEAEERRLFPSTRVQVPDKTYQVRRRLTAQEHLTELHKMLDAAIENDANGSEAEDLLEQ